MVENFLGQPVTHALIRDSIVSANSYVMYFQLSAGVRHFSALTLLVGRQEGHPAYKNSAVGCWHGYLSGARCRLAYGPADSTATHCLLLQ